MGFKEKARNIAVVSQTIQSVHMSVEEYVLMGRIPYQGRFHFFETKHDLEVAHKYMKLTGVFQHKDKIMSQISGGEQQLAAIARALTQEPNLLLLDEPTSHLDITHQVQVLNLIQRLNKNLGLTVLMNIHDLNLAGEYCDYLILLKNGGLKMKGDERETQMKAEALMSEAKSKAKATLEEAEMKARAAMEEVEEELKTMSAVFKTLQNGRDDFLGSLRSLSNELLEKVERPGKQARNFEIEEHLNKARDFKIDLKLTSRNLEMSESENQQIIEDELP